MEWPTARSCGVFTRGGCDLQPPPQMCRSVVVKSPFLYRIQQRNAFREGPAESVRRGETMQECTSGKFCYSRTRTAVLVQLSRYVRPRTIIRYADTCTVQVLGPAAGRTHGLCCSALASRDDGFLAHAPPRDQRSDTARVLTRRPVQYVYGCLHNTACTAVI